MLDWLGIPRHCAACEAQILTVWVGNPCPAVVRDRTVPHASADHQTRQARRPPADHAAPRPRQRRACRDAEIHLLANDYNAWVASDHPALARTWIYPRVRSGGRAASAGRARQIPLGMAVAPAALRRRVRHGRRRVASRDPAGARHRCAACRRLRARAGAAMGAADRPDVPSARRSRGRADACAARTACASAAGDGRFGVDLAIGEAAPTFEVPGAARRFARNGSAARRRAATLRRHRPRRPAGEKQPTPTRSLRWTTTCTTRTASRPCSRGRPVARNAPAIRATTRSRKPVLDQRLPHVHPFRGPIEPALGLIFNARTSAAARFGAHALRRGEHGRRARPLRRSAGFGACGALGTARAARAPSGSGDANCGRSG